MKEEIKFQLEWRKDYIECLEAIEKQLEKKYKEHPEQGSLRALKYKRTYYENKFKLYFERQVYKDWVNRAKSYSDIEEREFEDARDNMKSLLAEAKTMSESSERIKGLLAKYAAINVHDKSQLSLLYKSLKIEVEDYKKLNNL